METKSQHINPIPKPLVYAFTDYRKLLKEFIGFRQQRDLHFSLRMFSRLLGFQAHNYMSLVLQGKRNLNSTHAKRVATIMKLTKPEAEYFEILVAFNQSPPGEEKQRHLSKLLRFWKQNPIRPIDPNQYEIVSRWYCLVIREMVLLDDFKNDPDWIALKLGNSVRASEVAEAIELLKANGLLKEIDGRLVQVDKNVLADGEVQSLAVRNYHRALIPKGIEALDSVPMEDREINGTTLAVSKETFLKIKKRLKAFQRELLQMLPAEDSDRKIYQLNMQLFPILKR